MTDAQSTTELVEQIREGALFAAGGTIEGQGGIEMMAALLEENTHPDFVTVMVSMDGVPREYPGVPGFKEALSDWITPYERFRLEIDEVLTPKEKIVFLVRQVGTTKHGAVDVETPSASVWSVRDGRIGQATFYLDQRAALEAAGIDPDAPR